MSRTILITGGAGFIGSNFVPYFLEKHPDSGVIIPGFEIPFFAEALELCKEASKLISKINILGWDIAITHSGPVMIEVNNFPGFRLYQRPIRKGLRSKILKALSEKQS